MREVSQKDSRNNKNGEKEGKEIGATQSAGKGKPRTVRLPPQTEQ